MEAKRIGENISALRKVKGITQENLARAIGVTSQAVSKWENGGIPDIELLCCIADHFKVSINYQNRRKAPTFRYGDISRMFVCFR